MNDFAKRRAARATAVPVFIETGLGKGAQPAELAVARVRREVEVTWGPVLRGFGGYDLAVYRFTPDEARQLGGASGAYDLSGAILRVDANLPRPARDAAIAAALAGVARRRQETRAEGQP